MFYIHQEESMSFFTYSEILIIWSISEVVEVQEIQKDWKSRTKFAETLNAISVQLAN